MPPIPFDIAGHQARGYAVETPVYQGPLDLLLQLIERAELDITKLALAQVTSQYLAHLKDIKDSANTENAEEVSAFLVIAAKLVQIKSEVLLPRPPARDPDDEDEEDPGEALARRLREYKRYKAVALGLGERETQGLATYLRLAAPPKVEGVLDMEGLGIKELVAAAKQAFGLNQPKEPLGRVVSAPRVTIRQKIGDIVHTIKNLGRVPFRNIIGDLRTRLDVVVSFLALLELVKRNRVAATQSDLYGEITIEAGHEWQDDEDFELEFGE
jgi:segregation and condensation protein A